MSTYEELSSQLSSLGEVVDSVKTELAGDIRRLQEAVAKADNVPAEVQSAVDSLGAKIDSLKALDVPNPEPETPETVAPVSDENSGQEF